MLDILGISVKLCYFSDLTYMCASIFLMPILTQKQYSIACTIFYRYTMYELLMLLTARGVCIDERSPHSRTPILLVVYGAC